MTPAVDAVEDQQRFICVPGGDGRVHGNDRGVGARTRDRGDAPDRCPELGIDDRPADRGFGERGHRVRILVRDHPGAKIRQTTAATHAARCAATLATRDAATLATRQAATLATRDAATLATRQAATLAARFTSTGLTAATHAVFPATRRLSRRPAASRY